MSWIISNGFVIGRIGDITDGSNTSTIQIDNLIRC